MMDRRWTGIVLLVAAVAAAVVIGSLRSKQVSGSAAPALRPGPPSVGDCLGQFSGFEYPEEAPVVPCDQPHFAEVAAVGPGAPRGGLGGVIRRSEQPQQCLPPGDQPVPGIAERCVDVRVGLATRPQQVRAALIQPTELERKLGSAWVACAAAVGGPDLPFQPYDGTLRDAASTGHYPSTLGTCPASPEQLSLNQNCDRPHDMESFGTLTMEKKISDGTAATASCAELVKRATGLSDPTAGGRMTVSVVRDQTAVSYVVEMPDAPGGATIYAPTPGYSYYCLVRTTGKYDLTGPLSRPARRPDPAEMNLNRTGTPSMGRRMAGIAVLVLAVVAAW